MDTATSFSKVVSEEQDYDMLYNNKVILSDKNLKTHNYSKLVYPLMSIFKRDEKDVKLLIEQTLANRKNICFTGSFEACETVKEKLTELKLDAEVL